MVCGGAGFIGSKLTKKLVSKGYNVTVLDNLSKQIHGANQDSELYQSIKDISKPRAMYFFAISGVIAILFSIF